MYFYFVCLIHIVLMEVLQMGSWCMAQILCTCINGALFFVAVVSCIRVRPGDSYPCSYFLLFPGICTLYARLEMYSKVGSCRFLFFKTWIRALYLHLKCASSSILKAISANDKTQYACVFWKMSVSLHSRRMVRKHRMMYFERM